MNVIVFDTETTSLNKPFCYNIGYVILNTETKKVHTKKDFVIEQIWHNLPLFSSAYYANKREQYIKELKARKTKMTKFGLCMRTLQADLKRYEVKYAYAFNSPFDEKVMTFNCEWYRISNPFDTIPILDIRSFAIDKIAKTSQYQKFCDDNSLYTDSGNYLTTAESIYQYIKNDIDFIESHTALADSEIEAEILLKCLKLGSDITENIVCPKSVPKSQDKYLIIQKYGEQLAKYHCKGYTVSKARDTIYLR